MTLETKFLTFTPVPNPGRKTLVFAVHSKAGASLGRIGWYTRWRRYVFGPDQHTLLDATCLTDIVAFITQLMDERKSTAS